MADTIVDPGYPSGVIRIKTGDSEKYIAIANDCNNRYCHLNPYAGGKIAIAENIRNLACAGAVPLAMTNNLNFGNPYNPETYHLFSEAVRGLSDACKFFDVPVIGGNVSLYNQNPEGSIDPTPVVSMTGIIDEKEHITTHTVKSSSEALVLLGGLPTELGGSLYIQTQFGLKTGDAPSIDLELEKKYAEFVVQEIQTGRICAAHDLSEGGLMVALAEMLFDKDQTYGAQISLDELDEGQRIDTVLFGESQNRYVVSVPDENLDDFVDAAQKANVECFTLGEVTEISTLSLHIGTHQLLFTEVDQLRKIWDQSIPDIMQKA
jgi:phosphoribosylformylglycinamidine synthase